MQQIKQLIADQVNTVLFEYFTNISKDQITTQLSKGQILLSNLQFKQDILKKFLLPLSIKESKINNISITFGTKYALQIDQVNLVVEVLNLYGKFVMESSIKLQILDSFKQQLLDSLLKGFTQQDKEKQQPQDPKKKMMMNILQSLELDIKNINITFVENYCTKSMFGIKLETLTCKASQDQKKIRNIEIINLKLFWQDTLLSLNCNSTLEDNSQDKQNALSFKIGVKVNELKCQISKVQTTQIVQFAFYVEQFIFKRENQSEEKTENDQVDKEEIKQILKEIPLTENSISSEKYDRLQELSQKQSIQDLKQIQFEIMKFDKGEEIVQLRKKKMGWFGGMVKYDKKMSDKIVSILEELEKDPSLNQQFISKLEIYFDLRVNQFEIQLISKYKGLDNILILSTQNANLQFIKKDDFQLDFSVLSSAVILQYGGNSNYLFYKNEHFQDKNILEIHFFFNDEKENLNIQNSPSQILLNQQQFEQYYDFYYFVLLTQNHLPNIQKQAEQKLQQINQNQKYKEINVQFEKIYILSTNGKETFLFSPGQLKFQYKTSDMNKYLIRIQDINFGFSEIIRSSIDFITEQHSMNSLIRNRNFKQITNCSVDIVIELNNQELKTEINLDSIQMTINPQIYKYFYLFYETHYQQPFNEFLKQSKIGEEKKDIVCYVSNKFVKKLQCLIVIKGNYLNVYEKEQNKKIFNIDLRNIPFRESQNSFTIALQMETEEIFMEFEQQNDLDQITLKCLELRDDQFFMNYFQQNEQQQASNLLISFQQKFKMSLGQFQLIAEDNQKQMLFCIELNGVQIQQKSMQKQSTFEVNLANLEIFMNSRNQQDSQILCIVGPQETFQQSMIHYNYVLNEKQTLGLNLPYIIFNYKFLAISKILEFYSLHLDEGWSLTKFIINSYLTYYPDIQICFSNLEGEVLWNQQVYRKSEFKQIALKQNNEFKFRLFSDQTDQANLQLDGSLYVCYKVINPKTGKVEININQLTALFTEQMIQNKYKTSIKKKNKMERMILSPCKIGFELQLDFDSKTIKNEMNIIIDQLSITFGTQDILYFKEQMKKLFVQIEKFYESYDLSQFLVFYRSKLFSIVATIQNSIKVVLVDDFFDSQLPLFGGILEKPKIMFQSDLDKLQFKVINNFEVWNYHQVKLDWEPLIESIGFFFDFKLTFQTQTIQLDYKVQKDCNLNLSTELFKNIFKTQLIFNQFKENTYKKKQPIPILKYNCYEIYNQSGVLVVGNGNGKNFQIENNRKFTLSHKESLNFEIYTEQDTVRIFDWQLFTPKTRTFETKGTTIIIETIIDEFMNSSKTFISSKVLIVNQTCHRLNLRFKNQQEIILLPLQKNIPIDKTLQQSNVQILPGFQQKSSFQLIDKQTKSEFYDCKNAKQSQNLNTEFLQLNTLSFRIKTVQDPLQNQRIAITIGPITVFQNPTPFSIMLLIQGQFNTQNQQIILMPNEMHELYDLSLIQNDVKFSFVVERFYESQKYTYSQLQTGLRFKLEDESWIQNIDNKTQGLNLLIISKPNNYGTHQIIICYDYPYIINNTNFDLIIYQGTEKFQNLVSGQKYHTAQATLPLENIKDKNFFSFDFRNQNLKGETIKIEDFSSAISFYFCYKEINNSISYIPIQIEFKTKQWGDFSIQQVEIFLQYQIINKLEINIQLTQGYQKQSVLAGSQESLRIWDRNVLNQQDPKYVCNIDIQKEQQFQNIAYCNIYNYTQSIIQIQQNEGEQRLFIKISIFENSNQYYLVIEEETQKIPYMLINESKDLVIFLEDSNIILKYKDRYSFAAKYIQEQDLNYKIRMCNEQQMIPVSFVIQCGAVGLNGRIEVGKKKYNYSISQNKTQKLITFQDFDEIKNQDNKQILKSGVGIDAAYNLEMAFAFDDNIFISYIENQNIHTKELLLAKISDVKFDLSHQNEKIKVVFKLNRIQIDSQSKRMSKHKNILQSEVQQVRNNLNFEFEIQKFSKKSIHFNQITCNPGNFQLAIDEQFYKKSQYIQAQILEIQRTQIELFQNSLTQTDLHNLSRLDKQLKKRNKLKTVFVKKLILHPMDVKLSYYNDVYTVNRQHYVAEYIKSQPSKLIKKILTNYIKEGGAEQVLKTIGQFIQNKLLINQIKLNYFEPIRPKRALFSLQKIFKPYKSDDAKAWLSLKGIARTINHNIKHMGFLGCFQVYQKGLELKLFIFEIMLCLYSNSSSLKEINYKSIQLCCQNKEFLQIEIYLNEGNEIQLSFTSDTELERAYSNIQRFLE